MSSVLNLLRQRRSIRQFTPQTLSEQQIAELQEVVLRAPTSRNQQPCHFIFVTDKELLSQLAIAKPHGAAFLANTALAIVICANPQRSDVWIEDCSIAATLLHLAATDLGLGSCWVQIRGRNHNDTLSSEGFVRQSLNVPEGLCVDAIVGVGHAAETLPGHADSELLTERIHVQRFTQP